MVPSGSEGALVIVRLPTTVSVNSFVAKAAVPSVTLTVKRKAPAVSGEPLMTPVDEFSNMSPGREPPVIDQEKGAVPPTAVRVMK